MNCGNTEPHPGHSYTDANGKMEVCLGVPPNRWEG